MTDVDDDAHRAARAYILEIRKSRFPRGSSTCSRKTPKELAWLLEEVKLEPEVVKTIRRAFLAGWRARERHRR